jgi:hypothetical protein
LETVVAYIYTYIAKIGCNKNPFFLKIRFANQQGLTISMSRKNSRKGQFENPAFSGAQRERAQWAATHSPPARNLPAQAGCVGGGRGEGKVGGAAAEARFAMQSVTRSAAKVSEG